jgi:hypothetical protein
MEDETGRRDVEAADGVDGVDGARAVHSVERNGGADDSRDPRGSLSEERRERTSGGSGEVLVSLQSGDSLQRISVLQRVASLQRSSSAQLPRTSGTQMQRTLSERLSVQQEQNAEVQERAKMNRDRCLMSTTLIIAMGLLLVYTLYIILLAS